MRWEQELHFHEWAIVEDSHKLHHWKERLFLVMITAILPTEPNEWFQAGGSSNLAPES